MKIYTFFALLYTCLIFNKCYAQFPTEPTDGLNIHIPFVGGCQSQCYSFGGYSLTNDRRGFVGQAVYLNGVNAGVGSGTGLVGNSSRTLSIWFKTTLPNSSQQLMSWGQNSSNTFGTTVSGSVRYFGFKSSSNDLLMADVFDYYDDRWHAATLTYNGSLLNIYIDGKLLSSKNNISLDAAPGVGIGYKSINNVDSDFFKGSIDEFRVYNRALSKEEVQELYLFEISQSANSFNVFKKDETLVINSTENASTSVGFNSGSGFGVNTFLGNSTGTSAEGAAATMVGYKSGFYAGANDDVFVGSHAGIYSNGYANTFVGVKSGQMNEGGQENVFTGNESGKTNITGSSNSYFGSLSGGFGLNEGNIQNSGAVGYKARVSVNNALVIGDFENRDFKVGIGVHNPQHSLDVKGVINLRAALNSPTLKINGNSFLDIDPYGEVLVANFKIKSDKTAYWPDLIFEPDYKLMSLSEVDAFIHKNKHLPHIPTANDVTKSGVSTYEITTKLLTKIEEITLYQIQQNDIIKEQMSKIAELKAKLKNLTSK